MSDPSMRIRDAIRGDNYFIVARLLKKDRSLLDNIDPSNGWSNLHYAAYNNHYQISEVLLQEIHKRFLLSIKEQGRNFSNHSKTPDSGLYTQLTDEDEIKLTFEKQTVLHVACLGNAAATLNLLLLYFNVCLDQRDVEGLTPTHICCIHGYSECLLILLKNGAYVDLQDNEGDTPLHKAFQYAHLNCLEILIKYGADDSLLNNVGWKPADVAFNSEIINEYKNLKLRSALILVEDTDRIKIPQSRYGPSVPSKSPSGSSFAQSTSTSYQDSFNRVNLPSIIPRKLSLSSMVSDDHMDRIETFYDTRSVTGSYKNSKSSSPAGSVTNLSISSRKNTINSIQDAQLNKRIPISTIANVTSQNPQTSPRKSVGSIYSIINESPNSKKSSLSTRTFRSNSQASELSPIKTNTIPENPSFKSRPQTPRTASSNNRRGSNSQSTVSLKVEEASSKLQDFKLKNVDRLKLDTKLGNIINNSSQELLTVSPTDLLYKGAGSPEADFEPRSLVLDTHKRSKILSIPILSSRTKHKT